jgi:hypothetical protein
MNAIASPSMFAPSTMRRVRREEVAKTAFVKPDGLDLCLSCWKDSMTGDQDNDLGVKTMTGLSGGVEDGEEAVAPREDMYEAQQIADQRIAAATDAMINSLVSLHRWAIYRSCSIASVWRFPNADFLSVAAEARDELTKKLKRNVCTSTLF